MSRPVIYSKEKIEEIIALKSEKGIPVKQTCRDQKMPYVSVNRAIKRYQLSIPKKYAETAKKIAANGVVGPPSIATSAA